MSLDEIYHTIVLHFQVLTSKSQKKILKHPHKRLIKYNISILN